MRAGTPPRRGGRAAAGPATTMSSVQQTPNRPLKMWVHANTPSYDPDGGVAILENLREIGYHELLDQVRAPAVHSGKCAAHSAQRIVRSA